jgi:hypothetical protein
MSSSGPVMPHQQLLGMAVDWRDKGAAFQAYAIIMTSIKPATAAAA